MYFSGDSNNFAELAAKFGVPSVLLSGGIFLISKIWPLIQQRFSTASAKSNFEQVGITGATDVVTMLNNTVNTQAATIAQMRLDYKALEDEYDGVATAKQVSDRASQQAQSDLYLLTLRVQRLEGQLNAAGVVPAK